MGKTRVSPRKFNMFNMFIISPARMGGRTNVQQLTCNIDLSNYFYYLFFSFVLIELKPFVLKGKVLGEKFWKKCEKVRKIVKNYETILPFSCCPLVFFPARSRFWISKQKSLTFQQLKAHFWERMPETREMLNFVRSCNHDHNELTPENSTFPGFQKGQKGAGVKGGRGRKLSHFSFCCAFRCCVVYSPCFPVWGEEKVMTIYEAGPLAAGPLCGLLRVSVAFHLRCDRNPGKY